MTTALLYATSHEVRLKNRPPDVILWQTGIGIANAHEATERLLEQHPPHLILSAGYAAGLEPGLRTGDLVVPTEVLGEAGDRMIPDAASRARLIRSLVENGLLYKEGPLLTVWNLLKTPAEKEIAATRHGGITADMETAAVAAIAIKNKIPWLSLRVAFDPLASEINPRSLLHLPKMTLWHFRCRGVLTRALNIYMKSYTLNSYGPTGSQPQA